jgi:CRP-like cAMP-binding protein
VRKSDRYVEALGTVSLFEGRSKRELMAVARRLTPLDVPAGRSVTQRGVAFAAFVVVINGAAVIIKNGQPHSRIERGGFFGELALLVPHAPMPTVVAGTDMTIGVATRAEFIGLVHDLPSIAVAVMENLAMRAIDFYALSPAELPDADLSTREDQPYPTRPFN